MITNNILIDTSNVDKKGVEKTYISTVSSPKQTINNLENKNAKIKKPAKKGGPVGYLMIVMEMVGVSFAILAGIGYLTYLYKSWAIFIGGIFGLILIYWALSELPNRAKYGLKIVYFKIHVFVFMVGLGSSGFLYSIRKEPINPIEVLCFTLITAIPSVITHLPYLKKDNIDLI